MKPTVKLILGLATLLPLVYMILYFVVFISLFFSSVLGNPPIGVPGEQHFASMFIGHFIMMLWIMALLVFYIVHLFKNESIPNDKKALWAIVIFLGNVLAMPVYWYIYVWNTPGTILPGHISR